MNPLIRLTLVAAALLGVGAFAFRSHTESMRRFEHDLARERLRAAYVERAAWIRSLSDGERYRDEFAQLARWYKAEWNDISNRFPELQGPGALAEMEAQVAAGKMAREELANRREWYDATKAVHQLIEQGNYDPLLTSTTNGVRLDVVGMRRENYEGKSRLRLDVVAWGAPRREIVQKVDRGMAGSEAQVKFSADFDFRRLILEFIDEQQKLVGGTEGGAPVIVVERPERWFPQFPPMAVIGTYWLDPFPDKTASVSLRVATEVKSPWSAPLPAFYEWRVPARPEWRVRTGESFDAEERLFGEDQVDRSATR